MGYSELLHTTAYDQPHIFKIGYSDSKETYYFMAKSFTDKAMWIKEIENITLRCQEDDEDSVSNTSGSLNLSSSSTVTCSSANVGGNSNDDKVLAKLDLGSNVYTIIPFGNFHLFGSTSGLP